MMHRITAWLLAGSLALTGCSTLFDREVEYEPVKPERFVKLNAVGYAPISAQQGRDQQQKMLQAMKASKLDAYRELAEMVYGQKIDASEQLRDRVLSDDKLSASVKGLITGARVVKTYALDDVYVTELELDFEQVYYLYQNSQPRQTVKSVRYY